MATRSEIAVQNKMSGMNCAQAVAMAYADKVNVDEETLLAMTQALGVGIGATMEGTCGAIVGASLIVGLAEEGGRPAAMKKAGSLLKEFKEQNGVVTCKELKGIDTGVVIRECNDCVADAAGMLEKYL